jgi:hypothetical protein
MQKVEFGAVVGLGTKQIRNQKGDDNNGAANV